jgi:plasmid stabilization system protein ParE
MAQALIWSNEALDDVDLIAEYIGRDSRCHARATALSGGRGLPAAPLLD